MDLENIVQKLEEQQGEASPQAIRAIAADIYYSGEAEDIINDSSLVSRLFERWRNRSEAQTSVNDTEPRACPICKTALENVKLDKDRPALWCPRHFVVFPIKQEKKEEGK